MDSHVIEQRQFISFSQEESQLPIRFDNMALKETQKSAVISWCPVREETTMLALGGVGYSAMLELCGFDLGSTTSTIEICASVTTENRFRCITWGGIKPSNVLQESDYSLGIIAGGMEGGRVTFWNPATILRSKGMESGLIMSFNAYEKVVSCLEFNPHREHVLASGGDDGEVHVVDINNPHDVAMYKPGCDDRRAEGELMAVGWNRKVSHILATASSAGTAVVWDLKQQKPAIRFRDPTHRHGLTSLAWLPDQATQLVVAYDDEKNPSIQLWDLRNANYPLKEAAGHAKGILNVAFSDIDSNLMLSCGKDNRTACWSFHSGYPEIFYEIVVPQWHLQAKWSSFLPGIFAAASHCDKVEVHSVQNNKTTKGRYVPKWFKRQCGVNCGFGGKIVTFDSVNMAVKCRIVATDKDLAGHTDMFDKLISNDDFINYCTHKITKSQESHENLTWRFVRLLFFENNRSLMVRELGYESDEIISSVENFLGHKLTHKMTRNDTAVQHSPIYQTTEVDPEKFFQELGEKTEAEFQEKGESGESNPKDQDQASDCDTDYWNTGPDSLVKKSILIGNLDAAVDVCIKRGRMADALILASSGNRELWEKTRQQYIESQSDNFIKMIGCIIDRNFSKLIAICDLLKWQECLAILCTYSDKENFKELCEKLASRLEEEKNDIRAAVICYLCAGNFSNTVQIWHAMLLQYGSVIVSLQDFVEKMRILKAATNFSGQDCILNNSLIKYAEILANSGRTMEAMKYMCLLGNDCCTEGAILKDRIYHSNPESMEIIGIPYPSNPFAAPVMSHKGFSAPSVSLVSHTGGSLSTPPTGSTHAYGQAGVLTRSLQGTGYGIPSAPVLGSTYSAAYNLGMNYQSSGSSSITAPAVRYQANPYLPSAIPSSASMPLAPIHTSFTPHASFTPSVPMASYSMLPNTPQHSPAPSLVPIYPENQHNTKMFSTVTTTIPSIPSLPPSASPIGQPHLSSAPTAAAAPVIPGMPVPWPIPTTSQQLSSTTFSTLEANQRVQAATSAAAPGMPMAASDLKFVMQVLNHLLAAQAHQDTFSKRTEDLQKRIEELYNKLRDGAINKAVAEKVLQMCNAIDRGDYVTAQKVHIDLSTTEWHFNNKNWLMGLKRLLPK